MHFYLLSRVLNEVTRKRDRKRDDGKKEKSKRKNAHRAPHSSTASSKDFFDSFDDTSSPSPPPPPPLPFSLLPALRVPAHSRTSHRPHSVPRPVHHLPSDHGPRVLPHQWLSAHQPKPPDPIQLHVHTAQLHPSRPHLKLGLAELWVRKHTHSDHKHPKGTDPGGAATECDRAGVEG